MSTAYDIDSGRTRVAWRRKHGDIPLPTYVDGSKRENCFVRTDRIRVAASTCRHSVQFGCYVT